MTGWLITQDADCYKQGFVKLILRYDTRKYCSCAEDYRLQITHLVKGRYVEVVQDVFSVMAAYCDLCGVCTMHCVRVCIPSVLKIPVHSLEVLKFVKSHHERLASFQSFGFGRPTQCYA